MTTSSYISHSEDDTRRFAAEFASKLRGNERICLVGPFGSGKTVFVRGFVESFGISSAEVMSPTFTLVREYGSNPKIYHIDLYRLEKEEDIFEAGIFEIITSDNLVLIEWADRLKRYLPLPCITIQFSHVSENQRHIQMNEQTNAG